MVPGTQRRLFGEADHTAHVGRSCAVPCLLGLLAAGHAAALTRLSLRNRIGAGGGTRCMDWLPRGSIVAWIESSHRRNAQGSAHSAWSKGQSRCISLAPRSHHFLRSSNSTHFQCTLYQLSWGGKTQRRSSARQLPRFNGRWERWAGNSDWEHSRERSLSPNHFGGRSRRSYAEGKVAVGSGRGKDNRAMDWTGCLGHTCCSCAKK